MIHGIKSYFGGLGDTLQFSTLPEMFHNQGDEVFLTEDAPFRNSGIKFIWDSNPYIKGQSNINWTLGDIPGRAYENKFNDFIKNWEYIHGLTPKNSFPKVYYTPKDNISNLETLIDISSITISYDISNVIKYIKENYTNIKLIINPHYSNDTFGFDTVLVKNLKEYLDLVNCCKTFISLNSGPHMLAASIRHINQQFKQICFMSSHKCPHSNESWHDYQMSRKLFILPSVNYIKI